MKLYAISLLLMTFSYTVSAQTSMAKVLAQYEKERCYSTMMMAAEQVIKENHHRLLASYQEKSAMPTVVSGVIQYKDRESHVSFAAFAIAQQCTVKVMESFTVKLPCISVREEVFKRWSMKGKLNAATFVLENSKKPTQMAFLSDAIDGSYCLVTRHNQFQEL